MGPRSAHFRYASGLFTVKPDSPWIHEKEHSIQVIPVLFKISRPESFKLFELNFQLRWHLHELVTSCQQFIPIHSDSWNSCFWFVKKQGVLGQQQNAQGTNTYDTMNEIFKEDGIFDNLPSVSILRKIHFNYHDFNIFEKPCKEAFVTHHFQIWTNKLIKAVILVNYSSFYYMYSLF